MSELKRVVKLAELLAAQRAAVDELKKQLKEAEEAARRTEREDLPELMAECGLQSVVLEDGSKVEVREEVDASITAVTHAAAMKWLTENDFGGLIKTNVTVAFDRGDHEAASELAGEMLDEFGNAVMKETVHPATLRSFVKEQMAQGAALPLELFNVYPYNIAKITKGKK